MKNDQVLTPQYLFKQSKESTIIDEVNISTQSYATLEQNNKQIRNNIKCVNNNEACLFCLNDKCQATSSFLCKQIQNCICQQKHLKCQKGTLKYLIESIEAKKLDTQQIKTHLNSVIDEFIDNLCLLRDNLMEQIDQIIKYQILNQQQRQFIHFVQNKSKQQNHFTGQKFNKLWGFAKNQGQIFKNPLLEEITKKIFNLQKQQNILIQNMQKDLKIHKVISNHNYKNSLKRMVVYKSEIIKTEVHLNNLVAFFPKKIKQLNLLFQASKNNFEIKKYFQKCGKQTDTIIICTTNRDKIIGGYTPLMFESPHQKDTIVNDPSKSSFIFSLTNNDKFQLKKYSDALRLNNNKSHITFGDAEFRILDKSNVNECQSYTTNNSYENINYKPGQRQSYIRLNGNIDHLFKTKQWEVWKVQFA